MATSPQPTSGSEAGANPAQGELATGDRSGDDVGAALHGGQVSPAEDSEWCGDAGSDEERDDSDFSLESDSGGFGEEELATDSGLDEDEWMEDIGNFLFDTTLNIQVAEVIGSDKCENRCARGKAKELESLLCSLSQMTKSEQTTSLYTLLGVLMQVSVYRKRGRGECEKFHYSLPL
ncbi:hypothetical protein PI124_g4665 [Phytophthora idaei]|nr:hypothetical protein PI125_g10855 [Phytophthora idaei]KAG3165571.1 hypothetical protein PI126_g4592 [Phytophthora idaei]KAG3250744.1 hypothetical protein PI124_g4665 [Phytophthora idaei]